MNKFNISFDGIDTFTVWGVVNDDNEVFVKNCDSNKEAWDYIDGLPEELFSFDFNTVGIEQEERKYFWELVKAEIPDLDIMKYEDNQIWNNTKIIDYRGDYFYNIHDAVANFVKGVRKELGLTSVVTGDTRVLMEDGSFTNVSDITVGSHVVTSEGAKVISQRFETLRQPLHVVGASLFNDHMSVWEEDNYYYDIEFSNITSHYIDKNGRLVITQTKSPTLVLAGINDGYYIKLIAEHLKVFLPMSTLQESEERV